MQITFRQYPLGILFFTIRSDEIYAISVGISFILCLLSLFAMNNIKNPIVQRSFEKMYHIVCMYVFMSMDIMFAVAVILATVIYSVCFHYRHLNKSQLEIPPRFYATVSSVDVVDVAEVIVETTDMRI